MSKLLKLKSRKMLVIKRSNFAHGDEYLPIFQILIFKWEASKNETRGPPGLKLAHI